MAERQKSALVTGCSEGGIGESLARELHNRGLRVFATARKLEKMKPLQELGCDCLVLDVEDEASIKTAAEHVKGVTDGKLDLLINNAGFVYLMPFADSDIKTVRRVFDVNVISIYSVTQPFLPLLVAAGGTVANITSINAQLCPAWQSSYSGAKAALNVVTDTMRLELEPLGVKVVTVHTGAVGSHIFNNAMFPKLPQGSLYEPIRNEFESADFFEVPGRTPGNVYAKAVVTDLLKKKPQAWIWHAKFSTMTRWVWRIVICLNAPGLLTGSMRRMVGLSKLSPPSRGAKKNS